MAERHRHQAKQRDLTLSSHSHLCREVSTYKVTRQASHEPAKPVVASQPKILTKGPRFFSVLERDLGMTLRAFPHSIKSEQALLCACFLRPEIISQVRTLVRAEVPKCGSVHCPLFRFHTGSARKAILVQKTGHGEAVSVACQIKAVEAIISKTSRRSTKWGR